MDKEGNANHNDSRRQGLKSSRTENSRRPLPQLDLRQKTHTPTPRPVQSTQHKPLQFKDYTSQKNQEDNPIVKLYESNDDWRKEMEEESESLKQLLQYDTLKLYGKIRGFFLKIQSWIKAVLAKRDFGFFKKINKTYTFGVLGVMLVVGGFGYFVLGDKDASEVLGGSTETANPTFAPLTSGNSELEENLRFDEERDTLSYQDKITNRQITVSQQTLPNELKSEEITLDQLAQSLFNKQTIERFETNKGLAYIVTEEAGSQRVVFADRDQEVLVFLYSQAAINEEGWLNYINQLN